MTTQIVRNKIGSDKVHSVSTLPLVDNKQYRCIYCTLQILGNPIGCPINRAKRIIQDGKHCENISLNEFSTFGVFCSYSCAKAYAQYNSHDPTFAKSITLLAEMYSIEHNESGPITITPSPSPLLMAAYGGTMSEDQYRAEKGKIEYISNGTTIMHPMVIYFNKKE